MSAAEAKARVLVTDDSPTVIAMARQVLEGEGYEVFVATDGASCLEKLPLVEPDLLILDVMMPGMDGYETCARLRAEARWKELPVIFFSALAAGESKAKAFELGASDYVTKPIDPVELVARVRTHLKAAELRLRELALNEELERGIEARTAELRAALDEKTVLLQEINHRVMNNLQILVALIGQQMAEVTDEDASAKLRDLRGRVRAMAFVYHELEAGGSFSSVRLRPFLESVVADLAETPEGRASTRCDFEDISLDISRAMPFGLAANELVSMALAPERRPGGGGHASPLSVTLTCREGRCLLSLRCGPGSFSDPGSTLSIGRVLIRLLADQLEGHVSYVPADGSGAELDFPLEDTAQ